VQGLLLCARGGSPARCFRAWGAPGAGNCPPAGPPRPRRAASSSPPRIPGTACRELQRCGRTVLLAGRDRVTVQDHRSRALRPAASASLRDVASATLDRRSSPESIRHLPGGRGQSREALRVYLRDNHHEGQHTPTDASGPECPTQVSHLRLNRQPLRRTSIAAKERSHRSAPAVAEPHRAVWV
jgi:hypothetical protein